MNDFLEMIKTRHSQRSFIDQPLSREHLLQIVDCARSAATARNVQPWEFIVITDRQIRQRIADTAPNGAFIAQAAACLAVFCQDTRYYLEDGCAATENALLAATALGIASCWVAGDKKPYAEDIRNLLSVPSGYKLVSLIALGFAAEKTDHPPKRSLDDVVHWEKF
ncbi:MAG: nitroreductase family protein [bacterium]